MSIALPATCKLCGKKFYGPSAGGPPTPQLANFLGSLGKHLVEVHTAEAQKVSVLAMNLQSSLFLAHYTVTDPELAKQCDRGRWDAHQETLPVRIRDEKLEASCSELARKLYFFSGEASEVLARFEAELIDAFKTLRDLYEEPNKYPREEPATVVSAR